MMGDLSRTVTALGQLDPLQPEQAEHRRDECQEEVSRLADGLAVSLSLSLCLSVCLLSSPCWC